jgi:hypothetical protein
MPYRPLRRYNLNTMETLNCPYCDQEKNIDDAADFKRCRFCGFRSSMVDSEKNGRMLIVDRRMPYLQKRCQDLASRMTNMSIIVDRRVAQDPWEKTDRRIHDYEEDEDMGRLSWEDKPIIKEHN